MKLGNRSKDNREDILRLLNDTRIPKAEYKEFVEQVHADAQCILDCIADEENGDEENRDV